MSFDVNVLSSKPVIKAAANMQNDGGAGNLGYMSQGRKEQEEKEINIFAQKPEIDTFTMSGNYDFEVDENFDIKEWLKDILLKIKKLIWKKQTE